MEEANAMAQQQQQQLLLQQQQQQQQLLLLQQLQQQQQHHQQQHQQHQSQQQQHQQQLQQAMARFPSNIDAHLRPPGLHRSILQQQQQQQQNHHQQQQHPLQIQQQHKAPVRQSSQLELQMAHQDAWRVCHPDVKRPFSSLEDACERLLPYHVVADYEAEEDDRILDSDMTGQMLSRSQHWDHTIATKVAEFIATFEKQMLAFNIISRKRAQGEFRSEEKLMIEQALLQDEKQAMLELRAEIASREKAGREAEAKMRMVMVQAEQARVEVQAHSEMIARVPVRGSAVGSQGDEGAGHELGTEDQGVNMDEMLHGWGDGGDGQREDEEPSEDFLNDENEPENGAAEMQDGWQEVGELDLNAR